MPDFLEKRLKAEYGADSAIPYKIMNRQGLMRGQHETAKGAAMQAKHDAKVKPHTGFRSVLKASANSEQHHISAEKRKSLPASKFGLPGARKYPVDTAARAANAKARATQQVNAGNLSPSSKAQIDRKANAVLGKGKPKASVKNPFTGKAKKKES